MRTSSLPLKIYITAKLGNNYLILTVKNSGSWIENGNAKPDAESTGKGLDNIKQRLENMYGEDFRFSITKSDSGVEIRIEIPVKPLNTIK